MDPLLQVFFDEASELLADAEEALVQLEKTPKDGDRPAFMGRLPSEDSCWSRGVGLLCRDG